MSAQSGNGQTQHRNAPKLWESAIGRGEDCLKANARRHRVKARNPARAALSALRHDNLTMTAAQDANLHVAVYDGDDPSGNPHAVFALQGTTGSPQMVLRFARLQPSDTPLHQRGSPLDRSALQNELPRAARLRAEDRLGFRGVREIVTTSYWEREFTLYCGTAAVLAALGFPMTPGVFVVGAIILALRGLIQLTSQELRLQILKRKIAGDESLQTILNTTAIRHLFAESIGIQPETLNRRLAQTVLRGAVTVPDLHGEHSLHMYVDEDARIAVGGLRPARLEVALPAENAEVTPEDLNNSDNILTIVFRRPKRRDKNVKQSAQKQENETRAEDAAKLDLEELGRESKVPAKVDIDDLGGARQKNAQHSPEDEIVDAEIIEDEQKHRQ